MIYLISSNLFICLVILLKYFLGGKKNKKKKINQPSEGCVVQLQRTFSAFSMYEVSVFRYSCVIYVIYT